MEISLCRIVWICELRVKRMRCHGSVPCGWQSAPFVGCGFSETGKSRNKCSGLHEKKKESVVRDQTNFSVFVQSMSMHPHATTPSLKGFFFMHGRNLAFSFFACIKEPFRKEKADHGQPVRVRKTAIYACTPPCCLDSCGGMSLFDSP